MAIDIKTGSMHPGNTLGVERANANTGKAAQDAPGPGGQSSADKVSLTSQAEKLQHLDRIAKATPDIDMDRVNAIKSSIANGTFQVDSEKIADNLLKSDKTLPR
jgi:negative regulator of flagellin synthesis FlgM